MEAADGGSKPAADALFSALYAELRRIARNELARHGAPVSLSATTLLHQVYIEISGREGTSFPDRNRFMGYAARVMRGLIIDHARSRCAQKRGGQFEITALGTEVQGWGAHYCGAVRKGESGATRQSAIVGTIVVDMFLQEHIVITIKDIQLCHDS